MRTIRLVGLESEECDASADGGSQPLTPAAPVFDEAGFVTRMGRDGDLMRLILHGFVADIPLQLRALDGFLASGDRLGAERKAHAIKGASGTVSAEALCVAASDLERLVKQGSMAAARDRLDEVNIRFLAFAAAVRAARYVL